MICQQCKLIHSDWLSCEQAKALNEFREPTEEALKVAPIESGPELALSLALDIPKKRGWPKGKPRKPR